MVANEPEIEKINRAISRVETLQAAAALREPFDDDEELAHSLQSILQFIKTLASEGLKQELEWLEQYKVGSGVDMTSVLRSLSGSKTLVIASVILAEFDEEPE